MLQILSILVLNDPEMSLALASGCRGWMRRQERGELDPPCKHCQAPLPLPSRGRGSSDGGFAVCSLTSVGKWSTGYHQLGSHHGVLQRAKVSASHLLLLSSVLCILGRFRRGFENRGSSGGMLKAKHWGEREQRKPSVAFSHSRHQWGCLCRENWSLNLKKKN